MGTINRFDVSIAIFLRRCFNYYIKKRTYIPPTQDEIWESLFIDNESITHFLNNEIKIVLFRDSILCKFIYFGFEENEIKFLLKYLKKGDTFLDVGANIGMYSLLASKLVEDRGKIVAFEPTPIIFERLQQNIRLNELTNVYAFNLGLSNQKSTIDFHVSKDGHDAWNSFALLDLHHESETIKIDVDTIDSFLIEKKIDKVDLIKVDVEGWEKYVLEGSVSLLQKEDAPIFLVEFTETNAFAAGYYLGEIFDYMKSYGYDWYAYDAEQNLLINEKKKLHYPYENLIAIKNIDNCLKRITE